MKTPLPTPPLTRMRVLKNTCDTHAYTRSIGQYKWTKCAYTCEYGQSEGLLIPWSSVRFRLYPEDSNPHGFELHRPSIKGIKLLLKIIKAIIIITLWLAWSQASIHCSVNNTGPHVYTCLHWHIKHLSGAVSTHPTTCTHARTQARLERWRSRDCARSYYRCRKFCSSPLFNASNRI